jgi:hypothetical protein
MTAAHAHSAHAHSAPASGAEQAAQAIVDLINARPRSPRQDEIADIIKTFTTTPPPATCGHCDALDREYGPATKTAP